MRPERIALACLALAVAGAQAATVEEWTLPSARDAAQPNLHAGARGGLHLTWLERDGDAHVLRHAVERDGEFSGVNTVARGDDWFVNWADFPSLVALANGDLVTHLLVRSAPATYAYDVWATRSSDGGASWSAPTRVHDDGTQTEHGFVALWAESDAVAGIAWLDGRLTAAASTDAVHAGHHGAHGGAMTLRSALLVSDGKRDEHALDARTCDCCQTDAAMTARGPVVVYRDRSADEIRDIAIVRRVDGRWTAPATVHADGWRIPACPVNGPAVAARGDTVVVAWYQGAGTPSVQLARSDDAGATFAAPIVASEGAATLGRVDLAIDDSGIVMLWMDERDDGQRVWLASFDDADGALAERERVEIAHLPRGRATGFPRLALRGGDAYVVHTRPDDNGSAIRGVRVRFGREPAR